MKIRLDYTTLTGFRHEIVDLASFLEDNTEEGCDPDFPVAEIEAAIAKGETYRLPIQAGLFVDISKA